MCDEETLMKIMNIINSTNDDTVLKNNLRSKLGMDNATFELCIQRLVNLGYVKRGRGGNKKIYKYVFLTKASSRNYFLN